MSAFAGHEMHEHAGRSSRGDFDDIGILLKAGLGPGQIFVDAGCGDGHFSVAASEMVGPEGLIESIDVHGPSILSLNDEIMRKGIKNIRPRVYDLSNGLPIGDSSADMVLMANVLHGLVHNGEEKKLLDDVHRVLKDQGKFLVIEFKKNGTGKGPLSNVRISQDGLYRLLSEHYFKRIDEYEISQYHYASLYSK